MDYLPVASLTPTLVQEIPSLANGLLAVDREAIASQFYDGPPGEPPAGNVIVGIPAYDSPNTAWAFDLAHAGQLLDEAGWVRENDWAGQNVSRHQHPAFDALYEEALATTDPEHLADLFIQMNDILVNDSILLPLVQRAAEKYAISHRLNNDNVGMGTFEGDFWHVSRES